MTPTIKVPPYDNEAEVAVLASMLFDAGAIDAATTILISTDFYRPDHGEIFRAMANLRGRGEPVDVVTLTAELTRAGTIEQIGREKVVQLAAAYYTSANILYHAQEVRRYSEARQNLKLLHDLLQKPDGVTASDLREIADDAESRHYVKDSAQKARQALYDFKASLHKNIMRIDTGFTGLDFLTGGIRRPSVFVLGAFASAGKTAFALNVVAKQRAPVVVFSLEMSVGMIIERVASAELKIDYGLFNRQRLSPQQKQEVEAYTDTLEERELYVFDDVYHVEQQLDIVTSIQPRLVVVDYVQIVRTHRKIDTKRLEIDHISAMYKQMARQNNCTVLVLSQLARPTGVNTPQQAKSFVPTMRLLKESGALEANGDYVGILHRPFVLYKSEPAIIKPEDGYILIDKNKFGQTGLQPLRFDGKYQLFYEVERAQESKPKNWGQISKEIKAIDDDAMPF